jgi:hypothetical protein
LEGATTVFWESVSAGVVANLGTIALTVGAGVLLVLGRWRALMRFWDIRETRKLRIYLSHLRIVPGGAIDAQGTPRSYQGSVVTQLESEMGAFLRGLFVADVPGGGIQPNWTKALLLVNADVDVQPSPAHAGQIDPDGTVISLGSPGYNSVSAAIEVSSPVKFGSNNSSILLPGGLAVTNPRQSVVVRLRSGGRTWFYVAGLSEGGTAAAAYYLATAWRRLDKTHRSSPSFFVVIEIVGNDHRNAHVVSEGALNLPTTA